ncbi:altronate dehydratase [Peribacillus deserti]|uniref:Altronate dehydratase n=1 Tax=Peribacillus deserti TaxID=673318 RepID=A0ABS2QEW9_9BACI|nr:UxaA family hydrolase [Peribacillus deserti]MBM7691698.1 altronate dehydratase [Peribacillus deserti]
MVDVAAYTQKSALIIDPADNVAVALQDLKKGEQCHVSSNGREEWILLLEDIPFGHKLAIEPIGQNESVLKYGEEIGKTNTPVKKGEWIHVHNMFCERGGGK